MTPQLNPGLPQKKPIYIKLNTANTKNNANKIVLTPVKCNNASQGNLKRNSKSSKSNQIFDAIIVHVDLNVFFTPPIQLNNVKVTPARDSAPHRLTMCSPCMY